MIASGQNHPSDARIQRQHGQLVSDRCHLVALVEGTQLLKQLVTVCDGAFERRFHERESVDITQFQGFHAQND